MATRPTIRPRKFDIDQLREQLVIQKDNLDDCLIKQPELYDHVADARSLAVAVRDEAKLDLEIMEAEESQAIRNTAAEDGTKLTEGGLAEKLLLIPRVVKARRELLKLKAAVEDWDALKSSYEQRSYALKDLVPMYLSRFSPTSMRDPRDPIIDQVRAETGAKRREDWERRAQRR